VITPLKLYRRKGSDGCRQRLIAYITFRHTETPELKAPNSRGHTT
jgi:hypothetical protein